MNPKIRRGILWVELALVLSLIALTGLLLADIITARVFALLALAVAAGCGVAFYHVFKKAVPRLEKIDTAKDSGATPSGWICYIWGVFYPLVYLSFVRRDRQHPFLRFHCIQCLLLFALLLPVAYWQDHSNAAGIAFTVLVISWLVAMVQAGRGHTFKLPVLGNIAERFASRGQPKPV